MQLQIESTFRLFRPRPDPVTCAYLGGRTSADSTPVSQVPLDELRDGYLRSQAQHGSTLAVDVVDRKLFAGPAIRVIRAGHLDGRLPVVVYFHGGGWVIGSPDTHDRIARELAYGAGAAVVLVDYSRSPEVRYPVAMEEGYAVIRWIAAHGAELGLDGARIAVAGDSSGGNLATVVAMLAARRGGPELAGQVLLCPTVDAGFDTPSFRRYSCGYWLTAADARWFWDQYIPSRELRCEPTASPLRASLDDLRGMPPALIVTAEFDVLRDEAEAYARRLAQANVPVADARFLGTVHSFMVINALAHTAASRAAVDQASAHLRRVLG
jgi:acetyl esterase/lipase